MSKYNSYKTPKGTELPLINLNTAIYHQEDLI